MGRRFAFYMHGIRLEPDYLLYKVWSCMYG